MTDPVYSGVSLVCKANPMHAEKPCAGEKLKYSIKFPLNNLLTKYAAGLLIRLKFFAKE